MGYRIVVAGATGNVGREVLAILAEREFPIAELAAVGERRAPRFACSPVRRTPRRPVTCELPDFSRR